MSLSDLPLNDPLVLYGISPPTFAGLSRVLPAEVLRYFSGEETLELTTRLIRDVSWDDYEAILEAMGERHFRHTYSDGTLEMMSPSEEHDWIARFLGYLVRFTALHYKLPIKSVGSTTRRRRVKETGLEPDESFFIQREAEVRGRGTRSATEGPPPDLAIEVDITHHEVSRLEAYAKLGIPEVWRYRNGHVEFFALQSGGQYAVTPNSVALPMLSSQSLSQLLTKLDEVDETTLTEEFLKTLPDWPRA